MKVTFVENNEPKKAQFQTKTLGELGPNLPIGIHMPTGDLITNLQPGRWTLKTEKQIAKLREKYKNVSFARFASMVMGSVYEHVGNMNLVAEDNEARKRAHFSALSMPDAL
jgi:hypothetical protein